MVLCIKELLARLLLTAVPLLLQFDELKIERKIISENFHCVSFKSMIKLDYIII